MRGNPLYSNLRALLLLLVAMQGGACMPDPDLKLPLNWIPAASSGDWSISTPTNEGLDADKIYNVYQQLFDEDDYHLAHSLLIVRHGRLVAEGYTRNLDDRVRLHNIKSITKSVTSLLVGKAIEQEFMGAVSDSITGYLGNYIEAGTALDGVTIETLLTMRSGLDFDNDVDNRTWLVDRPSDSVGFVLNRPMLYQPGRHFHYNDGDPHLVGEMVASATGVPLWQFANEVLFTPLGISNWQWEAYDDGRNYGGFGLYMTPRDIAKIGAMMVNGGWWQGEQIVSQQWITDSTIARANLNNGPYGYYWWIKPDFEGFAAEGHGGQYLYALPTHDMVIVLTANPYSDSSLWVTNQQMDHLVAQIVAAIDPTFVPD